MADTCLSLSLPSITVVVPVYGQDEELKLCLNALAKQDYAGDYTVIVIDNNAQFALDTLQTEYPDMRFIWEPQRGAYHARNAAIAAANTPLFAFTDADCVPHCEWLRYGVEALMANENIGLVGGKIVMTCDKGRDLSLAEHMELAAGFPQHIYIKQRKFAATANMFTTQAMFDAVGVFDASLKSGGDGQWGRRVYKSKKALYYAPLAIVEHPVRNAAQIKTKIWRVVEGIRDMQPHWIACLTTVAIHLAPPINRLCAVAKYHHPQLSRCHKILLFGYCQYINWYTAYCRVALQLQKKHPPMDS
ncbi:MAG: glycosyltransferase family 2 protein [Alphaproteobacteria bacterium]|nr:glycosyltransferase family 2 protein [Alphaproteobacteria bacterium]